MSLILDSWLRSQRNSDLHNYVPNPQYWEDYRGVVLSILHRSFVSILCQRESPTDIVGFLVCEYPTFPDFTIHYVYIKQSYRHLGLSTYLIRQLHPQFGTSPSYISHIPRTEPYVGKDTHIHYRSAFILNRKRLQLIYNPYLQAPKEPTNA